MTNTFGMNEQFLDLCKRVFNLVDSLSTEDLTNARFVRDSNSLLKELEEYAAIRVESSEDAAATALFGSKIHTLLTAKNSLFQDRLTTEVKNNARALRELLRSSALLAVVNFHLSLDVDAQITTKTYALKRSINDLMEQFLNAQYEEENRIPVMHARNWNFSR